MKAKVPTLIFFLILIIGTFLRFYNINYDNFWIDETITFWVANPDFSIKESFLKHRSIEQVPYLFNFIIKIYFQIFGYEFNYSRIIPALFASLSIVSVSYISRQLSNDQSYIFTAILISLNIYLISYAQELRLYSTLFFLSSISIIFFINFENKQKLIFFYLFILSLLFTSLIHPFGLIIYFSFIISEFKFFKKDNEHNFQKIISYLVLFLVVFLYYSLQFNEQYLSPGWIKQIDIKFFTNFYFSNFFGSRIVGLIYLITLFFLLIKSFKTLLENKKLFLLFSILILSYSLPLLYGLLFRPIIIPRYIIFVIIPIIILTSFFVFQLKLVIRNYIIAFVVLITFLNLTTEQTFKQFYNDRFSYKHDFEGALKNIHKSQNTNYSISINLKQKKLSDAWEESIKNYINFISKKNNYNLTNISYDKNLDNIWLICIHDLNINKCNLTDKKLIKTIKLNRIDLNLIP